MGNGCSQHDADSTTVKRLRKKYKSSTQPSPSCLVKRRSLENSSSIGISSIIRNNSLPRARTTVIPIDGFESVCLVAQGASSMVVKASKFGVTYAIKICSNLKIDSDAMKDGYIEGNEGVCCYLNHRPKDEADFMRKFDHPNIVKYIDSFEDNQKDHLFIVMEFYSGGSIIMNPSINIKRAFTQILDAVQYLHQKHIAHQDLKPSNILLDDNKNAKLVDFGTAIYIPAGIKKIPVTLTGTPCYFPPEFFTENECDPYSADIWSLGVTFYQIIYGQLPFMGNTLEEKARCIRTQELKFPCPADPSIMDLIQKMLKKDPAERITIPQIWNHPFMAKTQLSHKLVEQPQFYSLRIRRKLTV